MALIYPQVLIIRPSFQLKHLVASIASIVIILTFKFNYLLNHLDLIYFYHLLIQ